MNKEQTASILESTISDQELTIQDNTAAEKISPRQLFDKNVIFHIGMEKTGTKFLQRSIFPQFGEDIDWHKSSKILKYMIDIMTEKKQLMSADIEPIVLDARTALKNRSILVSNELIAGRSTIYMRNSTKNCQAICTMFPNAKIIYLVRRQDNLLESHYKMAVRKHNYHSLNSYLNLDDAEIDMSTAKYQSNVGSGSTDYRVFDFFKIIIPYIEFLGRKNVMVLAYEDFKDNQEMHVNKICKFIGIKKPENIIDTAVNVGQTQTSFLMERIRRSTMLNNANNVMSMAYNSAVYRSTNLIAQAANSVYSTPARVMPDYFRDKILEYHKDSNRELARVTGLDLERHGYF